MELELKSLGAVTFQMLITKLVYMLELTSVVLMVKLCQDRSLFFLNEASVNKLFSSNNKFHNRMIINSTIIFFFYNVANKYLFSGNSKLDRA